MYKLGLCALSETAAMCKATWSFELPHQQLLDGLISEVSTPKTVRASDSEITVLAESFELLRLHLILQHFH